MLSLYRQDTLEKLGEWKLGSDLSSDICGQYIDESFIYASMRNGKLTRVDLLDFSYSSFEIGSASSWSLAAYQDKIIAGTVDGKLLLLEKESMHCVKQLQLSRQNVKSLFVDGDTLYAAGQDKKLYMIDLPTFELIRKQSNVHRLMFDITGVQDNLLYTVSHPCCEISVWRNDGTEVNSFPYRLRLSGSSLIDGNALFISSRNINGIDKIELSDLQRGAGND